MIQWRLLFESTIRTEYTKYPFFTPETACELGLTDFSAIVAAVLKLIFALDWIVCDNPGNTCTEPVRLLKEAEPVLPVRFWAIATYCMYVVVKIAPVIEAVTDNTAIINNFVFLVIISTFVSPLRRKQSSYFKAC